MAANKRQKVWSVSGKSPDLYTIPDNEKFGKGNISLDAGTAALLYNVANADTRRRREAKEFMIVIKKILAEVHTS